MRHSWQPGYYSVCMNTRRFCKNDNTLICMKCCQLCQENNLGANRSFPDYKITIWPCFDFIFLKYREWRMRNLWPVLFLPVSSTCRELRPHYCNSSLTSLPNKWHDLTGCGSSPCRVRDPGATLRHETLRSKRYQIEKTTEPAVPVTQYRNIPRQTTSSHCCDCEL